MLVDNTGRVHCSLGNACGYYEQVHSEDAEANEYDLDDPEENEDFFSRISSARARALYKEQLERRKAEERTQMLTVVFSYDSRMSTRTRHFGPMTRKEAAAAYKRIRRTASKHGLRIKVYTSVQQSFDEIEEYVFKRIRRDGAL